MATSFLEFIRLEIDIKNVKTLFRLHADAFEEDAREMFISGGVLSSADFTSLNAIQDRNEFIDMLKTKIRHKALLALLEEMRSEKTMRDVEIRLTRVQLDQMETNVQAPSHLHSSDPRLSRKEEVRGLQPPGAGTGQGVETALGKDCRIPGDVNGDRSYR